MAWGRRKQEKEASTSVPAVVKQGKSVTDPSFDTVIGPKSVHRGEFEEHNISILGKVFGVINCTGIVHVGTSGVIEGDIRCDSIVIEGRVKGDVDAASSLTIEASGSLTGNFVTKVFINRPGGFFEGYSHMIDGKMPKGNVQTQHKHEEVGTAKT